MHSLVAAHRSKRRRGMPFVGGGRRGASEPNVCPLNSVVSAVKVPKRVHSRGCGGCVRTNRPTGVEAAAPQLSTALRGCFFRPREQRTWCACAQRARSCRGGSWHPSRSPQHHAAPRARARPHSGSSAAAGGVAEKKAQQGLLVHVERVVEAMGAGERRAWEATHWQKARPRRQHRGAHAHFALPLLAPRLPPAVWLPLTTWPSCACARSCRCRRSRA